jgi:hypothetical protein
MFSLRSLGIKEEGKSTLAICHGVTFLASYLSNKDVAWGFEPPSALQRGSVILEAVAIHEPPRADFDTDVRRCGAASPDQPFINCAAF